MFKGLLNFNLVYWGIEYHLVHLVIKMSISFKKVIKINHVQLGTEGCPSSIRYWISITFIWVMNIKYTVLGNWKLISFVEVLSILIIVFVVLTILLIHWSTEYQTHWGIECSSRPLWDLNTCINLVQFRLLGYRI